MKSIYIGNLSYGVNEQQIMELFSQYGEVASIKLVNDKETGRFKGYGFIEMNDENALNAISDLDKTQYLGRTVKVSEAKSRKNA
ncbi:RNA-binding protein [Helicobacter sp. 13S00401-1]|uniref:RNA recognition motif domain-containing protein n=1 Tax=unclassified Helicobacter TaxID=2593540 RepID=UPI000BA5DF86|nr:MULTISPECIES: RNA-binding protein [unclassified Helicobacter]PAF41950.1 RNA-binding protein [Helicobacter sp. 11S02629-2]PAF50084.1 RNA-binding protein [Helicobacter sp. 13S00401-1]